MYFIFERDKKKYFWMPGMGGILKWNLRKYITAFNDGDDELANKIKKTIYKTADTITKKYINAIQNEDIVVE